MSSQVLALFDSRIWSNDASERSQASLELVAYLQKAPESDVSYALKRILRGLGSPVDSSRSGFGLALTELLRACEALNPVEVLSTIAAATAQTPNSKKDAVDPKELLFAKLFGLHAVARAGICFHNPPALTTLFQELLALMRVKPWLQEAAAFVILDTLQRFPDKASDQDWAVARQTLFLDTAKEWHAQKLAWIIFLQASASTSQQFGDWRPILKGHFQNTSTLLNSANLNAVAKLVKGDTLTPDQSTDVLYQQLPLVLQSLIAAYASGSLPKDAASLPEAYKALVDNTLLSGSASGHSKAAGLRFVAALLKSDIAPAQQAQCLHAPNTIKTLSSLASEKNAALHVLAKQVLAAVVDLPKRLPDAAVPLLQAFTTDPASVLFDLYSRTKTVDGLVLSLEGEDLAAHISEVKARLPTEDIQDDEDTDEFEAIERNKGLKWAVDQLLMVSRKKLLSAPSTSKTPANMDAVIDILKTLSVVKLPTPELRHVAESHSNSILADLLSHSSTCEAQCQVLEQASSIAKRRSHPSAQATKALRATRKAVKTAVSQVAQEQDPQSFALQALCQLVTHLTYEEGEAFAGLGESVVDVVSAFKASNNGSAPADTSMDGEVAAEPSAVLVDYLITLMRITSSKEPLQPVVRSVAESVFAVFTPAVGEQAIRILQDQLIPGSGDDDEDEDDEEDDDDDEDDEDEDEVSEDEEEDGDDAENANDSDADSDMGINLDADPELRAKVEAALMGAGLNAPEEDGADSDEEVLLDDDQMMALDDQLAAAFKEHGRHKSAQKDLARQDSQTSQRALDLIDLYCKKEHSSSFVVELLQTLFDVATSRQPSEEGARAHEQLTAKATRVGKTICNNKRREGYPEIRNKPKTLAGLQRIHEIVRSSSAEGALACACSLYISKLFFNTDASNTWTPKVMDIYRQTLKDFVHRRKSAVRTDFILPLLHRGFGWELLDDILDAIKSPTTCTSYRRIQVVGLLQALLHANKNDAAKMNAALPAMSDALFAVLLKNSEGTAPPALNPPRTKEVLKTIMAVARVAPAGEMERIQKLALAYLQQLEAENGNAGFKNMAMQISKMGVRGEKRKPEDGDGANKKQKV